MSKRQLAHIKTFKISEYKTQQDLDEDVNKYVIEVFSKYGNFCKIKPNSKIISVMHDKLVNIEE